jgi:hypothetical protein
VITRALGTDPDVDVDVFTVHPEAGDVYLICSDGLSDMVSSGAIEEVLRRNRADLDATAKALVKAANRGGGDDNITAVLFEIVDTDTAPPGEPDERTREYALPDPDDEDTLHPEDGVLPPPPANDTMVMSAADVETALAEQEIPQAGFGRRLLALLVILALIAAIVVLVWQGLAH